MMEYSDRGTDRRTTTGDFIILLIFCFSSMDVHVFHMQHLLTVRRPDAPAPRQTATPPPHSEPLPRGSRLPKYRVPY